MPPVAQAERVPTGGAASAGTFFALSELLSARYAACGRTVERVRFEGRELLVMFEPNGRARPPTPERWVQRGSVWRLDAPVARASRTI